MTKSNTEELKARTPVFPKTMHQVRTRGATTGASQKAPKRDKVFSKSRDNREDRSARQIKTSRNTRTLSRGNS
jgi:hypothetical protein